MVEIEQTDLFRRNAALHKLKKVVEKPYCYAFSKLANELTLIITKKCNLQCTYCYDKSNFKSGNTRAKAELNTTQILNLIKQVKSVGCRKIRITGGEPFLREDILKILQECSQMEVNICTNSTMIDRFTSELSRIDFAHLHIHTSIDGLSSHKKHRPGSDPIEIVGQLSKIKREKKEFSVSINTVLNEENVHELCETYSKIKPVGIDRWTISFPRFVEKAQLSNFKVPSITTIIEEFKNVLEMYLGDNKPFAFTFSYFYKHELYDESNYRAVRLKQSEHPCLPDSSGCKGLVVDSYGNLLDCLVLPPLTTTPVNIRSCLEDTEVSHLMEKVYQSLRSPFYKLSIKNYKTCHECRYLKLCRGGCPGNMFWLKNELNSPDVISCALFYALETEILQHLPKFARKKFTCAIDYDKPIDSIMSNITKNRDLLVQIGLFN